MSRKRSIPKNRWARIMMPTPDQRKHSMSGYERMIGRRLDPWRRGLDFIALWNKLGMEWHWYDQTLFLRGTREWWILYHPFFWRNGAEFFGFEERFIKEATAPRGTMPEREFVRRARSHKAQLQLAAIQGPLLAAMSGGGLVGVLAQSMEKVNDVSGYMDVYTCASRGKGYEEACVNVLSAAAQSRATNALK